MGANSSDGAMFWAAGCTDTQRATTGCYDALGHLASSTRDSGNIQGARTYDALGRTTGRSIQFAAASSPFYNFGATTGDSIYAGSKLSRWTESQSHTDYAYAYDADGRLTSSSATPSASPGAGSLAQHFAETDGFTISSADSFWNLQSQTLSVEGSASSTLAYHYNYATHGEQPDYASVGGSETETFSYVAGNMASHTANGLTWTYSYDAASRLTGIAHTAPETGSCAHSYCSSGSNLDFELQSLRRRHLRRRLLLLRDGLG